jgi:hypothetical protein
MDAGLEALMVFVSALGGSAVTAFLEEKGGELCDQAGCR